MQLRAIDKARYSKHVTLSFIAAATYLAVVSLAVSTALIQLIGRPEGGNFWLNLAGVVFAALTAAALFVRFRTHPFLAEVAYVWDLKHVLNRIYRKQRKIEQAVQNADRNAMIITDFFYLGSRQLYELDNNTITLDDLRKAEDKFRAQMAERGVVVDPVEFDVSLLDAY